MKTDLQLQPDVLAELDWDPAIDAAAIGVTVRDGIVTLSGTVASFAEKWDAEHAARQVGGVQALAVAIDVALLWSSKVPDSAIAVTVAAGHVTLAGRVTWPFQRQAAVQAVRYLMGVTGVTDQIVIAPHVTPAGVSVDGGDVTLTGSVPTWTERNLACHAAWGTAGVHNVIDNLTYA